jgi:peptide/nickel transport system substrate-binding protein
VFSAINKVVKIDKYTVQFELNSPGLFPQQRVLIGGGLATFGFGSPEAITGGLLEDWQSIACTGPWMAVDFQQNVSMTWGRLPYLDTYKFIAIPDMATTRAAMRTGKIDLMNDTGEGITLQEAESFKQTNPDIQQLQILAPGGGVAMSINNEPFTDIRVRKALQLSIDRQAIAKTFYLGLVDGTPCGLMNPLYKGWCLPYDQWPDELQKEYSYNPAKAKELLTEAGYPDGFNTECVTRTGDTSLLETIKFYFQAIGVNMDINAMDGATLMPYIQAGKATQLVGGGCGWMNDPLSNVEQYVTGAFMNNTKISDPTYDALYKKLVNAIDLATAQQAAIEIDMYGLQQHWQVNVCPSVRTVVWQSYLKGYNGSGINYDGCSHWWIDQDLKKSMGR